MIASGEHAQVGVAAWYRGGWVVVGSLDGKPAIWASDDGLAWTEERVPSLETRIGHLTDVVVNGERLLISGWSSAPIVGGTLDRPLIVAGSPGGVWQIIDHLPLPANVGGQLTSVAMGGSLTVAGGSLTDGTPAVWTTAEDGVHWDGPIAMPADRGSSISSLVYDGTAFVAVGEMVGAQTGAAAWRSSDGISWSVDPPLPGSFADATLISGGVVAVGHDAGSATVRRLGGAREALPAPESADLTSVASDGNWLAAASATTISGPMWLRAGNGWQAIDVGAGAPDAVRSVAVFGDLLLAAGDDGSTVSGTVIQLSADTK